MSSGADAGRSAAGASTFEERFPVARVDSALGGRVLAKVRQLAGKQEKPGVAAVELDGELVDIGAAAAEAGRQRKRDRPGSGIDRAEEAGRELRPGLGDEGNAVAGLDAERDEAAGMGERVLAQLGVGVGLGEGAAGVVEIEPALALRSIIERFAKRGEVGNPAGQIVHGRSRTRRGELGISSGRCE